MNKREIIGYHGTTKEYADRIINENCFLDSCKDNEWLGHGVYFFQYISHAKWWVSRRRFSGKETAIVQALLSFYDDQLLDLDDPDARKKLFDIYKVATVKMEDSDHPVRIDYKWSQEQRWCFACNFIRRIDPSIGIIIYTFLQPSHKENVTLLYQDTQRQICVSDHSIISKISKVVDKNA